MGSQQTGSLSGDECWDLPFYSRITTRKITQLPIFPADDRFQCRPKWRLGYCRLPPKTREGGSKPAQLSNSAPLSVHNWLSAFTIKISKAEIPACGLFDLEVLTDVGDAHAPPLANLPKTEFAASVTYCLGIGNYNDLKKKSNRSSISVNFRSFFFSLDNENKTSAFQMMAISLHGSFCRKTAILYILSKTPPPLRMLLQEGSRWHSPAGSPPTALPGHWKKVKCRLPPSPSAEKRTHQETTKLYRSACSVTARNLLSQSLT